MRHTWYPQSMRLSLLSLLSLFTLVLPFACSDDAPSRPEPGSQGPYQSCVWEGYIDYDLCAPFLGCAGGVCLPKCEKDSECPVFEGFKSYCALTCHISCNDKRECPNTNDADFVEDGVPLVCGGACEAEHHATEP